MLACCEFDLLPWISDNFWPISELASVCLIVNLTSPTLAKEYHFFGLKFFRRSLSNSTESRDRLDSWKKPKGIRIDGRGERENGLLPSGSGSSPPPPPLSLHVDLDLDLIRILGLAFEHGLAECPVQVQDSRVERKGQHPQSPGGENVVSGLHLQPRTEAQCRECAGFLGGVGVVERS
jgi:hypothetical protein